MDHTTYQYNAPPAPSPHATPEEVGDAARTARHLRLLDEMTEIGADLVRRAHAALQETNDASKASDKAERCDRLIRSLRRTIALSDWIARARRKDAAQRQQQAAVAETTRRAGQKHRLHRLVETAIASQSPARAPDLRYRLTQRLNDWDVENDLATSPIEAAIARLCTEFGLTPPAPSALEPAPPHLQAARHFTQPQPERSQPLHHPPND